MHGGSGCKSFISRFVDHELIPRVPEEEMIVQLALRRSREEDALRQHSDLQHRRSIASAQTVPGSGSTASRGRCGLCGVRTSWRTQSLCGCAENAPWASSDANIARHACCARQRAREAAEALTTVDVGEAESHSPAPRIMHGCGRRNRFVVGIASSLKGSAIDLMSTGTVRVMGSDEEE
ncbi:putative methyltransferase PMT17 [Hordeum vulgare]|nr:putative methyltransferase PMT17 [Hordeum vulgare]